MEGVALRVWPEMPALEPPNLVEVWRGGPAEWRLVHAWLGPLIGGSATLLLPGFATDGGSIPRAAWRIAGHPFQLPCLAYFLAHDADYAGELRGREECDRRLLEGMRLDGTVPAAKRLLIHRAVRRGGWAPWARHTPEGIAEARKYCRAVMEEEFYAMVEGRSTLMRQAGLKNDRA